ncbi:MAG: glycoside hydrolase family 10 protein [Candidatus Sumerlaeaceae bacterium]
MDRTELRAVWASTLSPCMNSPEEIADLVGAARRAHLNCVIVQVRHRGMTFYQSSTEPPAPTWARTPSFDPLQTLLFQAHDTTSGTQRLDVYAWFNVFNFGKVETTSLSLEQQRKIKEWMSYTTSGTKTTFLDPAIPEVQEYLLSLIRECVKKYPVDGVNLDFIRYPEEEAGYHPVAIRRFQNLYGRTDRPTPNDPQWNEFRREQVCAFVRRCAAEVWELRPEAMLSVCAVGFGAVPSENDFTKSSPYRQVHQDWAGWAREGAVDIVTRMGYKREHVPAHAKQFRDWADFSLRLAEQCPGNLITIGIGGYFNEPDHVIVQYREAKRRGLGTSIFSYWRPDKTSDTTKRYGAASSLWERIANEVYPDLAQPPRPQWRKDCATLVVQCQRTENKEPADGAVLELRGPITRSLRADGNGYAVFTAMPTGRYELRVAGQEWRGLDLLATPGVKHLRVEMRASKAQ